MDYTVSKEMGKEIIGIEPKWNVKLPPEIKSDQVKLAWQDGEIKIRTYASIGSKFKLKMNASDERYGFYESELEIEVVGLW